MTDEKEMRQVLANTLAEIANTDKRIVVLEADLMGCQRNDRISKFKRRNLALYNRVVWGVLYHETFPKLSYGFNDEVRNSIRQELEKSLNPQKS